MNGQPPPGIKIKANRPHDQRQAPSPMTWGFVLTKRLSTAS